MRDEWFVARRGQDGNKRYGPVPLHQLRELVDAGKVQPADLVWREGMAEWLRADQCEDLFPAAPPPGPRRDSRDSPPSQDRRGYSAGPGRGPRGYDSDDDDRPYPRRRYPQQQSSGGWIVALLVGGGIIALSVLACGGIGLFSYLGARSVGPPPMMKTAVAMTPQPAFPPQPALAPATALDDGDVFQGGPAIGLGNRLVFRNFSELYYTDNVRLDEAQAVGDCLDGQGVFKDDHGVTVQVAKPLGITYQVRFCVRAGTAWNADVDDYYRSLGDELAKRVFPGSRVEVHLCDANMNTLQVLGN